MVANVWFVAAGRFPVARKLINAERAGPGTVGKSLQNTK
jgi:hypothetical protein